LPICAYSDSPEPIRKILIISDPFFLLIEKSIFRSHIFYDPYGLDVGGRWLGMGNIFLLSIFHMREFIAGHWVCHRSHLMAMICLGGWQWGVNVIWAEKILEPFCDWKWD